MDVTADQALAAAGADLKDPGAKKRALEFLQEILANGPVNAKEAEEEAEANGISERTLRRARMTLGIKVAKDGYQGHRCGSCHERRAPKHPKAATL